MSSSSGIRSDYLSTKYFPFSCDDSSLGNLLNSETKNNQLVKTFKYNTNTFLVRTQVSPTSFSILLQ